MSKEGTKHDNGKADLSLIPKVALEECARAFMHGETKYARYNYTKGFDTHRLVAAALRHLSQWQDGEDKDSESGVSHLGHALASVSMLLHILELGTARDTRHSPRPRPTKIAEDFKAWSEAQSCKDGLDTRYRWAVYHGYLVFKNDKWYYCEGESYAAPARPVTIGEALLAPQIYLSPSYPAEEYI